MAQLHSDVLDLGLTELTESTVLHVLSQEPTTYANVATYTLGNKATPTISAPRAATTGTGREVGISAITDGTGTATGTATHWALVDGSRLLAANSLSAGVAIASGNAFSLSAFTIRIPYPA
jgi:hypothetical protein